MSGTIKRERNISLRAAAGRAADLATDLLFPRRCPVCGKISAGICEACAKKLPYVRQPFCYRCGKPLQDEQEEFCAACRACRFAFAQGRALYRYEEPVRESMHAIKYKNRREYLEYYAHDMAVRLGDTIRKWDPQALVPVPMHASARRRRGYNQAEILAAYLAKETGIPVCRELLRKVKKTASQKELDQKARRANLKGAFEADLACAGQFSRVLLVDDIYTTGSTVHEAAKALRAAGVRQVYFVTMCIVPEGM